MLARSSSSLLAAAVLALALFAAGANAQAAAPAAAPANELPCPEVDMSGLDKDGRISKPCTDPALACDMEKGCMGAILGFISEQLQSDDLAVLYPDGPPSQDYITGCVAPYALDPEVTDSVPGDTLGAMIACNFTELTAVFDQFYLDTWGVNVTLPNITAATEAAGAMGAVPGVTLPSNVTLLTALPANDTLPAAAEEPTP